jgi:MFS family permease
MFFGAIQFLSFVWEYGTMQAGLLFVATPATMVVLSPIAGRLAERLGLGLMLVIAGVFTIAAHAPWPFALDAEPHVAPWIIGMASLGSVAPSRGRRCSASSPKGCRRRCSRKRWVCNRRSSASPAALGVAATITLTDAWTPGDGVGDYVHLWYLVGAAGIAALFVGARSWQQARSRPTYFE